VGDLYSILNLPETASKEELKEAFIAWKKEQQKLLGKGSREEQATAAKQISTVTVLYKTAIGKNDITSNALTSGMKKSQSDGSVVKNKKYTKKIKTENGLNSASQNNAGENKLDNDFNDEESRIYQRKVLVGFFLILILGILIVGFIHSDGSNKVATKSNVSQSVTSKKPPTPPVKPTTPEPPKPPKTDNGNKSGLNSATNDNKSQKNNNQQNQNPGKTEVQRQAIQTLMDFHSNITSKNYRAAYNCLSQSFQDRMRYDGWAAGFKTTVSSTPLDIKVYSESANKVVLTYNLQAVDNPGGTRIFSGTTVVIKTQNGWKINEITNKAK